MENVLFLIVLLITWAGAALALLALPRHAIFRAGDILERTGIALGWIVVGGAFLLLGAACVAVAATLLGIAPLATLP